MGAGRKDMISSYNSSLSCSRLMSSLCTDGRNKVEFALVRTGTYDQTQRTRGREGERRVRRQDHAKKTT